MPIDKELRLKALHVEAMTKIKEGFEQPVNLFNFLYDVNSFLLMKFRSKSTSNAMRHEKHTEIHSHLWFCNELLNYVAIPWSDLQLETNDQLNNMLDGFLGTMDHNAELYANRVTGLLEAFLTNEFDNSPTYSIYAQGFRALFDVKSILNVIETERLLERPKLTKDEIMQKAQEILNRR